ncbi:MAG: GMC family oxidoreductase N-terminal domain-containing protein [Rhodobacteraceae bacterium]|nr:GMC family oxidoreductase N-terminal domain-containing protein [Paracoccaceae bacterium]
MGYLRPVLDRTNLKVETNGLVRCIAFSGSRATGVEYVRGRNRVSVTAGSGVIVTADAIGTPKLLMLSGLEPATHLRSLGIDVIRDMQGSAKT